MKSRATCIAQTTHFPLNESLANLHNLFSFKFSKIKDGRCPAAAGNKTVNCQRLRKWGDARSDGKKARRNEKSRVVLIF
jgi:hypothetical protein